MATHEDADYFWELDELYPDGDTDFIYNGDDEVRQLKKVIKQSMPNIDAVIVATDTQINLLVGLTGTDIPSAWKNTSGGYFGTAATRDYGAAIGEVLEVVDVGSGVAGLPALDGSRLTGINTTDTLISEVKLSDTQDGIWNAFFFGNM